MSNRLFLALVSIALVATFAVLNWSIIAAPATISLGIVSFEAPLGMVLLGLTVFYCWSASPTWRCGKAKS